MPKRHVPEKPSPKRTKIRTIAKTARSDSYQFSVFTKSIDSTCHEKCVNVWLPVNNMAHCLRVRRLLSNLEIRRVHQYHIDLFETQFSCVATKKIIVFDIVGEFMTCFSEKTLTVAHVFH